MPVGREAVDTGLSTASANSHLSGANTVSLGNANESANNTFGFTSREDVKKQRKLEEARKSGLIPAEKDEEGKDINPHIPQYIAKAPWYLSQDNRPSLKHQRYTDIAPHGGLNKWYKRGFVEQSRKLQFRPGACDNCGALTHSSKDCTERPRKKGARWTGSDIKPDELLVADSTELQLDFDGKRDRYGGYDPGTYRLVVRDFELADMERKKRKAQELKKGIIKRKKNKKGEKKSEEIDKEKKQGENNDLSDGEGELRSNGSSNSSSSSDEEGKDDDDDASDNENDDDDVKMKEFDETNAPIGMKDDRTRTTTMNLRIREDTAKYLFNLDVNSAFYDPKTRSMRDNPLKHLKESEQGIYRGDNAMRTTGEAFAVKQLEFYSWEAYKHDVSIHSQAQPTQLELMYKEYHRKRQELVKHKQRELLDKYGGEEHFNAPKELLYSQTEVYREYNPLDGTVKRMGERPLAKSKYNDDSLFGEHAEVWGSWYDRSAGMWGYFCCKQLDKNNPDCSCATAAATVASNATVGITNNSTNLNVLDTNVFRTVPSATT